MSLVAPAAPDVEPARPTVASTAGQKPKRRTNQGSRGEPWIWLTGSALVLSIAMIVGLLLLVLVRGTTHYWPVELTRVTLSDGKVLLGEPVRSDDIYRPEEFALEQMPPAAAQKARELLEDPEAGVPRHLLRTGNFDRTGTHFTWYTGVLVENQETPEWATVLERQAWGRFYGEPIAFRIGEETTAEGAEASWAEYERYHEQVLARRELRKDLEEHELGGLGAAQEAGRLALRGVELEHGTASAEYVEAEAAYEEQNGANQIEFQRISEEARALDDENARYRLVLATSDGEEVEVPLAEIVRGYPANRLGWTDKVGIFVSRWIEYLTEAPREANSEGGVFPAIFGTVLMTMIMCVLVVPFGVLAALYLREYAKPGPLVAAVRVAVGNLAGVPSIVFGVFGLGFFCYGIGASLDQVLFAERLPNPTLGKGGLLWASLTLALLTLPVVVVAAEEALAAVPNSMREGSFGCGATKWQTIRRIVLPRALPGILTGAILAIARGAGEVAPLMLVGAVKLAPELPLAWDPPLMGTDRSFMHLGFHIYDLGFQSQNSEAAEPMVFTTALLLIGIVVLLNLFAMWVRGRLRTKYAGGAL